MLSGFGAWLQNIATRAFEVQAHLRTILYRTTRFLETSPEVRDRSYVTDALSKSTGRRKEEAANSHHPVTSSRQSSAAAW